mgnify:CR=1 FL=1
MRLTLRMTAVADEIQCGGNKYIRTVWLAIDTVPAVELKPAFSAVSCCRWFGLGSDGDLVVPWVNVGRSGTTTDASLHCSFRPYVKEHSWCS